MNQKHKAFIKKKSTKDTTGPKNTRKQKIKIKKPQKTASRHNTDKHEI